MPVYHVIPRNSALSDLLSPSDAVFVTHDLDAARKYANHLHELNSEHYHVVKVDHVWTTMTVGELMKEPVK